MKLTQLINDIAVGVNAIKASPIPLTFTANTAGSTVRLAKIGSPNDVSLQYSLDGSDFVNYTIGDTITLPNVGSKVKFKSSSTTSFSSSGSNYYQFEMSGSIAASGNINSLINYSSLSTYCYINIFKNCTSLTTVPILSATTLAHGCYYSMFDGCTNLTTVPEDLLPATTLYNVCYAYMFRNCSKLTAAPKLPATTLVTNCYYAMFLSCSSLSSVEVNFTDWNQSVSPTSFWLGIVNSTGTFKCQASLPQIRDRDHIPANWTRYNIDGRIIGPGIDIVLSGITSLDDLISFK